jgi:hypothetical protein
MEIPITIWTYVKFCLVPTAPEDVVNEICESIIEYTTDLIDTNYNKYQR